MSPVIILDYESFLSIWSRAADFNVPFRLSKTIMRAVQVVMTNQFALFAT